MPKTSTCMWFDSRAKEAADLYVGLFPDSRITAVTHYGKGAPQPEGSVLTVTFEIGGSEYTLLNGGKYFTLSPAASIVVQCDTQEEIDRYWSALSAVPQAEQCGWLQDRFGVSWQVVPTRLFAMLQDPDAGRRQRVTDAFMQMKKFDLADEAGGTCLQVDVDTLPDFETFMQDTYPKALERLKAICETPAT